MHYKEKKKKKGKRNMCLIFIKPKTAKNYLTHERFINALTNNPHAVGIVYRDNGKVNIQRFVKPEANKEEIYNIIKDKEEFAIHFRYATHGILNLTNTHPFIVTNGLCMMHNGVMSEFGNLNKDWSDTKNFVEYFLKPYVEEEGIGVVQNKDFKEDLEKVIGAGNKLLFIDKDFNFSIINENAGVWREGCWLSNSYSVEPPYSTYYNTYAPKDGTAGKSSKKSYNYYDDFYGSEDYGLYDDDYTTYLAGSMTRQEIDNFIGKEVASGYTQGMDIPYELEYDEDYTANMTLDELNKNLVDIGEQIKKGIYKGNTPFMWELVVDEKDIDVLLKNDDADAEANAQIQQYADEHSQEDASSELSPLEREVLDYINLYSWTAESELEDRDMPAIKKLLQKGLIIKKDGTGKNGNKIPGYSPIGEKNTF